VLLQVLTDVQDNDTVRNEVANLLRRSKCSDIAPALTKILDNPEEKPRFRSFAMQHLGGMVEEMDAESRQPFIAQIQTFLTDRHYQVRSQALQNLVRLKDPVGQQTAIKWLTNYQSVTTEALEKGTIIKQAIECVHSLELKEQIPAIRTYARDPNIVIARAAIVALADWHDEESLDAMKVAAASKDPLLARCGRAAVERMAQERD